MSELWTVMCAEFERLDLQLDHCPYKALAASPGEGERFVAALRRMQPGVTWRDVFPDMPAHWVPGRPETWTEPYRPLGPFDFQTLPTGPAVHVCWPDGVDSSPLEEFVTSARAAGWPVHGAGLIEQLRNKSREFNAHVVLDRGTSEDTFEDFLHWIWEQPGVDIAVVTRPVEVKYLE